jgi:hypothetical protein
MPPMNWQEGNRKIHAFVTMLAHGVANTIEVYLHRGFGHRFFGLHSLLGLGVLLFYFGCWSPRRHNISPLAIYYFATQLMLLWSYLAAQWRRTRGHVEHSRYSGRPMFFRCPTPQRELWVKEVGEPVTAMLVGVWTLGLGNQPLGFWLIGAGLCMAHVNNQVRRYQEICDADMQDSLIEQRSRMEQARDMQRRLGL